VIFYGRESLFELQEVSLVEFVGQGCDEAAQEDAEEGVEDIVAKDAIWRGEFQEYYQDQL